MTSALDGIRVLDFSRFVAGPICCCLLADMGAEVTRVETPDGEADRDVGPFSPQGERIWFAAWGHHKRGITLDLQRQEGKDLALRLIALSDVVVHNFTPGSPQADFLDHTRIREIDPTIVVAAISAYGQNGPWSSLPGFDGAIQALSGVMSLTGSPDGPPTRTGITWVDFSTAYNTALGIMFALYHRSRTGLGQMLDVSLLDNAVFPVVAQGTISEFKLNRAMRCQLGNEGWYTYGNTFKAKDGWVVIQPGVDSQWRKLANAIGRPELAEDPRYKGNLDRFANRKSINKIIEEWLSNKTVQEVGEALEAARVPWGPVHTVADVVRNPQLEVRNMLVDVSRPGKESFTVPGFPLKLSLTPASVEGAPPLLGEHNMEVYKGLLGLSSDEIEKLREQCVI